MYQPTALKSVEKLKWSSGRAIDVWRLFCDCICGNLEGVKLAIAKDPSLVRCHYGYRTPLYFAVKENQLAIATFLLEMGANPLAMAFGDSLVTQAHDRGFSEMAEVLTTHMEHEFRISPLGDPSGEFIRSGNAAGLWDHLRRYPEALHLGDRRSNQPIHWAVMTRQIDVVDALLDLGADINARRQDGARPIHLFNGDYFYRGWRDVPSACTSTPMEVLHHLLQRGADCDLNTACHLGDLTRVHDILQRDAGAANRLSECLTYYLGSGSPLRNAAATGHLEIVRELLRHGADPNLPEEGIAPNGHALYSAVSNQHFDVAKLLLEHGAYPNPEVESSADALSMALSRNDQRMVDLLCSHGATREVHLLGYSGDVKTAAAVFAANPGLANDAEALANAAGEGHEPFVRLMLQYQPHLPREVTFPGWLVCGKTREINDLLFAHGMGPNQRDWMGGATLHHLARTGDIIMAQYYLDRGADIHARDDDICSTPLAWAAKHGQLAMVQFLLERGAGKIHADDPPWATPLAWATRRGHAEVVDCLR